MWGKNNKNRPRALSVNDLNLKPNKEKVKKKRKWSVTHSTVTLYHITLLLYIPKKKTWLERKHSAYPFCASLLRIRSAHSFCARLLRSWAERRKIRIIAKLVVCCFALVCLSMVSRNCLFSVCFHCGESIGSRAYITRTISIAELSHQNSALRRTVTEFLASRIQRGGFGRSAGITLLNRNISPFK